MNLSTQNSSNLEATNTRVTKGFKTLDWTRKEKSSDLKASITRIPIPQDPHPNGLLYTTKDIQIAIL